MRGLHTREWLESGGHTIISEIQLCFQGASELVSRDKKRIRCLKFSLFLSQTYIVEKIETQNSIVNFFVLYSTTLHFHDVKTRLNDYNGSQKSKQRGNRSRVSQS